MLSKVVIEQDAEARMERMVERFLSAKELDRPEQLQIARERAEAKEKMERAIQEREEQVNPKLVEILKRHYGVDFDHKGKSKIKLGANKKSKDEYEQDIERLYQWAQIHEQRREELAAEVESEMKDKCPFVPSITNKSRQIYSTQKESILEKREKRQKELQEKRELKLKAEANGVRPERKYGTNKGNKENMESSAFSRRLPAKKKSKEQDQTNQDEAIEDEEQAEIKRDRQKEELESMESKLGMKKESKEANTYTQAKKAVISSHQADTFHKGMMEWCDKKEKNRTQKTVEHWIGDFENPDNLKTEQVQKSGRQLRSKASQVAHADALIGSIKKREENLEKERVNMVKGLFKPKVTQHIPLSITRDFSKRRAEEKALQERPVSVVYYADKTGSPKKTTQTENYGTEGSKIRETSKSGHKKSSTQLNFVKIPNDSRLKEVSHSLAQASDEYVPPVPKSGLQPAI